ncbi:hypothetical protein Dimus_036176 [Dionaea muscipula]
MWRFSVMVSVVLLGVDGVAGRGWWLRVAVDGCWLPCSSSRRWAGGVCGGKEGGLVIGGGRWVVVAAMDGDGWFDGGWRALPLGGGDGVGWG